MDSLSENFKSMTVYRLVGTVMALAIIIGTLTPFAAFEEAEEGISFKLIPAFPIVGIIIILAGLAIVAGVAFGKRIISIIGAGVAFAADIVIPFFLKTGSFYDRITGMGLLDSEAEQEGIEMVQGVLGDSYDGSGYNAEIESSMNEAAKEMFHYKIGFYLILIASIIAIAAFVIDLIKSNKKLEEKVMKQASQAKTKAGSFAETIVENTVKEQNGTATFGEKSIFKRSKEPWVCPNCKETNEGSAAFCVFCGETRPLPRSCYKCGTLLEDHMMFCPKCGTKYDEEKANEAQAEREQQSQETVCKYCGAKLPEGASFCGKCGRQQ